MAFPGPPGPLWAVGLLVWAGGAVAVGELLRGTTARWVSLWRSPEAVERLVLDFYLGGAVMYLLAALQTGLFVTPVVLGVPAAAAALLVVRVGRARRASPAGPSAVATATSWARGWPLVALGSALGLYLVELGVALPTATGNTFDSGLLTTYVSLLLQHGSVPLAFRPYGTPAILYPQGATVWFGWAQVAFGLPPARTTVLVTPLFLAMPPLSGYVFGRRLLGTERAGAAFALALAWLGPSTRMIVGGSNDLVISAPLVLLLAAQSTVWMRGSVPSGPDAAAFGLLLGYAGALNVVGTEWLLPALLLLGLTARPVLAGRPIAWLGRWGLTAAATAAAGIPSWYVLAEARRSPALLAGALTSPAGAVTGITGPQFVGFLDPFLFRGGDIELSPVPLLRLELAILLVLGVAWLLWVAGRAAPAGRWGSFGRWSVVAGATAVGWLALLWAADLPGSAVRALAYVSNPGEFSLWLFTLYGLVAAVPLVLALEALGRPDRGPASAAAPRRPRRPAPSGARAFAPVAFAIVVVLPAVVLTPTSLAPVLSDLYGDFGNVTGADFALFAWAADHLPAGARVLVAPGSAAQFLPGYARGIVLVYPQAPGWSRANASYNLVVRQLTNGTVNASGFAALASLDLGYVVVTGNSTVLWPAFWAAPLADARLANSTPAFPVRFHDGDAWVFDATLCRPASAACP